MSSRKWAIVGAAVLVAVTLGTYGFSLGLPLFLDDMIHFRWLAWHDFAGIWSTSRLLGYYRPLPFTLWKVLWLLQGRYDPPVLHAVNLALHILNTLLVMALVAGHSCERRAATAVGAALLFALFPFSYQAVPWVGSLTHPLVTSLILSSLVLHQASRRRAPCRGAEPAATAGKAHSRFLKRASLALALLAPFAHETGVLVAPLLFLLLVTDEEPLPCRQALREIAPYAASAAIGLAVWMLVPKGVKQASVLDLESRVQNAVYFLQALAYPVEPLATRLTSPFKGLSDLAAVTVVGGPAVLTWAFLLWRAGRGRLVALAMGWFALCVAPAWAMLGFSYVIDGPRLLYEAAVGAALFWAIPLDLRLAGRAQQAVARGLGAAVIAWAGWSGYAFVRARVPIYEEMRLAVEGLLEASGRSASAPLLCINYPSWFAPRLSTYALGHEGMALVPDYSSVADLWWLHTGKEREIIAVTLPDLQSHWRYHYVAAGPVETSESLQPKLRVANKVIVTRYDGADVAVYDAGGFVGNGRPPAESFTASFAAQVALLSATSERRGGVLYVELLWQCWRPVVQDTTVFLHVYDAAGRLVAQADGYPLMGAARLTAWEVGDEWRDVRVVRLPEGLGAGEYVVKAGLYPAGGGARLPATGQRGERFADEAVPIGRLSLH